MSLATQLWRAEGALARQALEHPFVQGIARGTLARTAFAHYVAQDAFFLDAFARAYALGVVHAPDADTLGAFVDLQAGVRDELRLHASYAASWGVDLARVEPAAATLAYTDFLLATALRGDLGLVCAATTPCMRLYAFLGQALAEQGATGGYVAWVRTYADPGFEQLAATLEQLLDRHAVDRPEVRRVYRRAMLLEVGFFDAAYGG